MSHDLLGRESFIFRRRKPEDDFAAAIYKRVAEHARMAELFEASGIPDTLDGRFDSLALHAALMIDRLRRGSQAGFVRTRLERGD